MTERAYLIPLGVAAALPDAEHANTYLAVTRGGRYWLVDCADSPLSRVARAGLDPLAVQGVILTHFHPDHVYGLPAFLLQLWLLGLERSGPRREPLCLYARPEVLGRVEQLVALFEPERWASMYPLEYRPVMPEVGAVLAEDEDFLITVAPTRHSVPTLAVKFTERSSGQSLVYSSDTEPCPEVEALARGAALLCHEATDTPYYHSQPAEVGALATRAGVAQLLLIHYEPARAAYLLAEARRTFGGPVGLAEEGHWYAW